MSVQYFMHCVDFILCHKTQRYVSSIFIKIIKCNKKYLDFPPLKDFTSADAEFKTSENLETVNNDKEIDEQTELQMPTSSSFSTPHLDSNCEESSSVASLNFPIQSTMLDANLEDGKYPTLSYDSVLSMDRNKSTIPKSDIDSSTSVENSNRALFGVISGM